MARKIHIPRDSGARSLGAEGTAKAIAAYVNRRGLDFEIVRNGSRGLYWLEPMVEVDGPGGRIAYGPVAAGDVTGLFDAGFPNAASHHLYIGAVDEIPYLKDQQRLTCARIGVIDPVSLDDYKAHGGYRGLLRAIEIGPEKIVDEVDASALRGRGGAGFPAGIKWRTAMRAAGEKKYIACNADEGDSGTFADRMIMEGDPFVLLEVMTVGGIAVGADEGFIYIRSEYPDSYQVLGEAVKAARERGYLGDNVLG
ncbi:MAG: formate dehydrogenase, partial [Candidatus Binataceae bacterium]